MIMKKVMISMMLLASFSLLTKSCSSDDDSSDGTSLDGTDTSGQSVEGTVSVLSDVATLDISLNTEALSETETVDASDNDYIENTTFTKTVNIAFNGTQATLGGDIDGSEIAVTTSGAHVTVTSSTSDFVTYAVSGTATDGSLKIYSKKKFCLALDGASITNPSGPAINIQSGKRAFVRLVDGTTSSLTDGTSYSGSVSGEDMKGCFFSEGQLCFSGKGTLNVYAKCKSALKWDDDTQAFESVTPSAIRSDDYIVVRPGTNIYVEATAGNGIKGNDALNIYGGVINVSVSADGCKALASDGNILISGGRTTAIVSGSSVYDTTERDIAGSACVKADTTFTITGGELYVKNTGAGGKAISVDQQAYFKGGTVYAYTTGRTYSYSSSVDSKAKGIKADGTIEVTGGTIMVRTTGGSGCEGIESKSTITISDGNIAVYAYDDAINAASHLYIKGGTVYAHSTGNDGLDSNGNLYIQGGNTVAYGTKAPECGIDANEEDGYTVFLTGGNLFAIGGGNSTPSSSSSTQGYVTASGSVSKGTVAAISDGSKTLAAFTLPAAYSGGSILMTASGMTSGNSYTLALGSSSTSLTASQYGASSVGGGGGGFPGGSSGGGNPGSPGRH